MRNQVTAHTDAITCIMTTFCTEYLHRNGIVVPGLALVTMMLTEYADQHGITYCWQSSFRRETAGKPALGERLLTSQFQERGC